MTHEEEMALRELAAGRCVIPKVTEVLGPMSLWSKSGFEAEIRKAVMAERERCAHRAGIALLGADRGLANRVDQAIRTEKGELK